MSYKSWLFVCFVKLKSAFLNGENTDESHLLYFACFVVLT